MEDFAWLIEAPGARYLGTREIGLFPEFFWTTDHLKATRFWSEQQADGAMMAVRRMEPALFAFAVNLGDARPIKHSWHDVPRPEGTRWLVERIKDGQPSGSYRTNPNLLDGPDWTNSTHDAFDFGSQDEAESWRMRTSVGASGRVVPATAS